MWNYYKIQNTLCLPVFEFDDHGYSALSHIFQAKVKTSQIHTYDFQCFAMICFL